MLILELLILGYFFYVAGYTAIFSVAAYFYRAPEAGPSLSYTKFCVLIPAYQEDAVILDTVRNSLKQFYPREFYDVVVIADRLKPVTIFELNTLPVRVIKVSFDQSTKVKSLNEAFAQLPDTYDYGVILDADNVMTRHFLRNMNNLIQSTRMRAIQGQRIPKNLGNRLSFLDGVSEAINNHIYRQGASALDLSASINGSGIVIDYALLKSKLSTMNAVGGFDRELELLLLKDAVKVYYYKDAIILDEKVSDIGAFQNQRRRWIASQYFYLRKYFKEGMTALFQGQTAFFNSAVLRNIQLPRLINICLLFALVVAAFFARDYLYFGYFWWPLLFVINAVAIFSAIPKEYYSIRFVRSLGELPVIFVRMSLLLFKMKGANRRFLHTPHGIKPN